MGSNIFSSALSGMNAAQYGLATTQHNIANANTPGFSRQVVDQAARPGQLTGAGFLGQGVDVVAVRRLYDQFISTQVMQEQTQASYLTTYHTSIAQIDNLLADPAAGASPAMQQFFDALNGVASSPESLPARQTLLSNAQFAVNRFQAIDQRLTDITNGLNGQLTSSVTTINSYAQQIAALNGNIKRATANAGPGQLPNDLLDQRDQLINQLNMEVKATVQQQSDGSVNVFIGNGQGLVVDEQAYSLAVLQSSSDPSKLDIGFQTRGNTIPLPQSSLQGGNVGAYLTFRDQTLEPARNALGRVALGLAASMNQQNRMGQDLTGVLGGDLFTAAVPRVSQGANNGGTATVTASITDVAALTTSDYQVRFDGTSYTMLRLSDNTTTNLGTTVPLTQVVDGVSVTLSAGMMKGDTFMIRPTADGARDISVAISDPSKIAAAAPIRGNAAIANTGTGTISAGTVNAPLPLNPNLQNKVTVTFVDATHFTVTDNTLGTTLVGPPGTVYNPATGATLSFNGWTVQIAGAPAVNDTFTVDRNTNATGDNRNALLMAGLQTKNILANGTASFQGAYGQLVGQIGAKTNELSVTSTAQTSMLNETIKQQQSISGVNLDEEAANLLRYQRAYEASAQAMKIANTMFDALLALG
ncbi:flagellar hook-associated protein FlgK [Ferrigenium kumadai]|uniref:Flagellar hook-associated protein 1 n=1 Tax=Ferrigenium kumadai TaxID=1682490 RepID=A0AAN1VZ28_9PROT|nr:flagellar hook-associated protein FlgK [Ferrigenium kumadai]BBI98765.1 flagellar hook-associated protein FlgK [Ferrigenium kumadai]